MKNEDFDPVKANEEFEREWYEQCVIKECWKPVREEAHHLWLTESDKVYRLSAKLRLLTAAAIAEGVAIVAILKMLLSG